MAQQTTQQSSNTSALNRYRCSYQPKDPAVSTAKGLPELQIIESSAEAAHVAAWAYTYGCNVMRVERMEGVA